MATRRVTMRDVANAVGVHNSTVSLALADDPRLSEETKRRIRAAAERLGYASHHAARALRTGRHRTLGLVFWDADSPQEHIFFRDYVSAMTRSCVMADQHLLLVPAGVGDNAKIPIDRLLRNTPTDGALLVGMNLQHDALERLIATGYPIVHLGLREIPGVALPCVSGDWRQGAALATGHLLERGHRRVAVLYPSWYRSAMLRERLAGWQDALAAAGIAAAPAWQVTAAPGDAERWLADIRRSGVTAVFCTENHVATVLLRAARAAGCAVPDDLAVVAFDEAEGSALLDPPLSTVAQPAAEIAQRAVERLLRRIEGADPDVRPLLLPMRLIPRRSSGDADLAR